MELFKTGIKDPLDNFKRWMVVILNFKSYLSFENCCKIYSYFSPLCKSINTMLFKRLWLLLWNIFEREKFVKCDDKIKTLLFLIEGDMKRLRVFENLRISKEVCFHTSWKEDTLLLTFVHRINDFKFVADYSITHHHSVSGNSAIQTSRYFNIILKYYWKYFKDEEFAFCTDHECKTNIAISSESLYLKKFPKVDFSNFTDISRPIGKATDPVVADGMPKKFTSNRDTVDLLPLRNDHGVSSSNVNGASLPPGISPSGTSYNSQKLPLQLPPNCGNMSTIAGTSTSGYFSGGSSEKDHAIAPAQAHIATTQTPLELQPNLLDSSTHATKNHDKSKKMQNALGAQIIEDIPKETEQLPGACPQYEYHYEMKFDNDVPASHQEVKQKSHATISTLKSESDHYSKNDTLKAPAVSYLHDKHKTQGKNKHNPGASSSTKAGFKQAPFPKKSCVVAGNKQFPLTPSLLAHPHMDHYFVKERTETRPGRFLARLVLHHEYLNKYVSETVYA